MKNSVVLFLLILTPAFSYTAKELSSNDKRKLLEQLFFVRSSPQAGSAIAVKNISIDEFIVCSYGKCLKPKNDWQVLPVKITEDSFHKIFVHISGHGWAVMDFPVEKSLFALRAPAKLRLPTAVQTHLENKDDMIKEQSLYNKKILKTFTPKQWSCYWQKPLESKKVSEFASTRTLPNGVTYPHVGLDLRAPASTPIVAVGDGIILSTDDQVVGGKTINIDHGKGLISRYLHLSEFKVAPGDRIRAGEIIALSGETGRVEAPHLHWEMRIHGVATDPLTTLQLMSQICDLK